MVGVTRGQVQVMQHDDDCAATLVVAVDEQVEHIDLVAEIEKRGRFIEQQDVGVLGEAHGEPHALALTAGELVDGAVSKLEGVGCLHCFGDDGVIPSSPLAKPTLVGVPTAADEISDRDAVGSGGRLGQQADNARNLLTRKRFHGEIIEQNGT